MRLPCDRAATHQDNRRFITEPIERDGGAVFRTYFLHESSPLQPLDVPGNFGQIIVELMPPVIGTYIELLDDLSQPLAHDRPVFGEIFWLSEKRFSGS